MSDPRRSFLQLVTLLVALGGGCLGATEPLTRAEARAALLRAVEFFRLEVSANGGYVWRYSENLTCREGERRAGAHTVWVQPPGTPTVGDALLTVYYRTDDPEYLAAAKETAMALVNGQLHSGGWDYRIEFDPVQRGKFAYRVDGPAMDEWNVTTLDDSTTQAALSFLMRVDQATRFQDTNIHQAALYALERLIEAQYPNGAWPQGFSASPEPARYPVLHAAYPESWSRRYPNRGYMSFYTFNDNTIGDTIRIMFEAAGIYGDSKYVRAAERAGDFILMAQMPEPQPAWAQQYDFAMHPAWARKFEPPSITGGESQQVLATLMSLYRQTGKAKYLQPVPKALAYLRESQLSDGRLARFYELRTNLPLYFTKDYRLTYRSDDLPGHYRFHVVSQLDSLEAEYRWLRSSPSEASRRRSRPPRTQSTSDLSRRASAIVKQMDDRGAWVEDGRLSSCGAKNARRRIVSTQTFVRNIDALSQFIAEH